LAIWKFVELTDHSFRVSIATLSTLLVFPTVLLFRKLLEKSPTQERCAWLTSILHIFLMVLFGVAIIETLISYSRSPGWSLPFPRLLAVPLLILTSIGTLITVMNLALSGLGAPFAIALSRRLANRWMYAWTRNPMVVSLLACLCSAALYLQSLQYLIWILLILCPAWLYFLKVYEERELEIRFGEPYLEYKKTTPFFWPRRPGRTVAEV
jgi:protein-S-isoprenylcysteine O-methyltransferase Ste14